MKPRKELYVAELMFNLARFVDESAIYDSSTIVKELPENCFLSQYINGGYNAFTAIYAEEDVLTEFAAKYSKFKIDKYDALVNELIGDFLNLHNGLFIVNLSDTEDVDASLDVPILEKPETAFELFGTTYILPVEFDFGTVNFVLSE